MALELDVADVKRFDSFREAVQLTLQETWGVATLGGLVNNAGHGLFNPAVMDNGAIDNGAPGARLHYDPHYYVANVLDPDGYSLEFVYKNWQHAQ